MSTVADKITYLNDTKSAIKNALVARGVSVSNSDTFRSYADKIGEIGETVVVEKEITKYEASINTFLGDVDENGVLQAPTAPTVLNFAGVTEIGSDALRYLFYYNPSIVSVDLSTVQSINQNGLNATFMNCNFLTSVDLSSLQSIDYYGMCQTFANCIRLTSADLSSLQSIDNGGMRSAFGSCYRLASVDLSSLQSVGDMGLNQTFHGCEDLASIDLHSLQSVGDSGLNYAFSASVITNIDLSSLQSVGSSGMNDTFNRCKNLTTISFPSLTSVQTNSLNRAFNGCSNLTEIHFRADMQETIEATEGYSGKWGASNATVYFDLIGTITVDGVAYARDEKQSIRVDSVKTFVRWKDANDNVVYTSYADNTEPAVGTVVYSDAGTTQIGTVEAVA